MGGVLTENFVCNLKSIPCIMVETGTNFGHTCQNLSHLFHEIHTIELSEILYKRACELFKGTNVRCHHGDSQKLLNEVIADLDEPVLFYLDAHYSGGLAAQSDKEVPLLEELKIIRKRKYPDVIICDDFRLFGQTGQCGCPNNEQYPPMTFNWQDITIEACREALGEYSGEFLGDDRLVFYRN